MTIEQFLKLLKENNFTNSEIIVKDIENASITAENGTIESYDIKSNQNYCIKVSKNTHNISINSTHLTEDLIIELSKNIDLIDQETKTIITSDTKGNNIIGNKESIAPKDMLEQLIKLSKPSEKDTYLTKIVYEETSSKTGYYNDQQVAKEKQSKIYEVFVESSSRDESGKTAVHYDYKIGPCKKDWNIALMKEETEKESKLQLSAHPISSRKTPVILNSNTITQLLSKYIEMFSSEMIQKKTSPLTDKKGVKIFSDKLNIIEDPLRKDLPGYSPFDDEGISTSQKYLVKEGIINEFLYNNKTSSKENKNSTGNHYGLIATRNAYIVPGDDSLEELIEKMNNGLVITEVSGINAGINTTSGDFSLQAKGYIVKNKIRTDSITLITISANIIDLFNNIISIGNDLYFRSIEVGSPSILFSQISISGPEDACEI